MDADTESHPPLTCPHFDPTDPVHVANPYPTYAALRRDSPIFYHSQLDVWVVSRHADIMAVVKQPGIFSSGGALTVTGEFSPPVRAVLESGIGMGKFLIEADGATHTRIRTALSQAFTAKRITEMEPYVRAVAGELIGQFAADGEAELVSQFTSPLPAFLICDLLGVPRSDFPRLKEWNDDWGSLLSVNMPEEAQVRCANSILAYEHYLHGQFLDRQTAPREDLITAMLPAELGGTAALSLGEAVYNVIDSIVSGYETTSSMVTNALVTLFEYRDQYDRISADPTLLDQAVEEVLRFASPVQGIFRVTTRPVDLGGATLPAAARVFLLYASANHDERRFDDPDVFDIDRPLARSHMTFSRGIHVCLGAALARLTIRISLELLQQRLPNLRPVAETAPRRMVHMLLSGYDTLRVEWDPVE